MLQCYLLVNPWQPSGGGRDLVLAFGRARGAGAATRTPRRLILGLSRFRLIAANRRRKCIERDGLGAAIRPSAIAFRVVPRPALSALLAPRTALAIEALFAILALRTLLGGFLASLDELFVTFVFVDVMLAPGTLLLEPCAILAQHAKIMVGVLKIIFSLDAVARELRVTRHALVFFEQLGGVAALAIVLAVSARLSAEIRAPLSTATASAAALTIVDQIPTSLRSSIVAPSPQADRAALMAQL
jgi:hypothetical protein